jgi:hypothetical protein
MEFIRNASSYSTFQNFRVVLPQGGEATLAPTSADHISFDANHHCLNGRPGDRCWMVCRGIEYGAHFHFKLDAGEWVPQDRPYVSRLDSGKDASAPAIKWLLAAALEIVREFVAQHPEALTFAERERRARDTERKQAELDEAERRVIALKAELAELEN